jgi:hypothetical protein
MGEQTCDTEEQARARRWALIRAAVLRHTGGKRPAGTGVIACPACEEGEVSYILAPWLSRLWAACTTPGCCEEWLE